MEEKRKALISEKIHDYTMYNHGQYRHYISLSSLKLLVEQICDLNECPQYIRITPLYDHCKKNFGIEFDEYMCYIEGTTTKVTPEVRKSFYSLCGDASKFGSIEKQYNIVNVLDVGEFRTSLWRYIDYLYFLIPKLVQEIKESYNLSETEIFLGEFCFEIHCE